MSKKKGKAKTVMKKEPLKLLSLSTIRKLYLKNYRQLLIVPLILFVLSTLVLVVNYLNTGELINRDVSLKGGISITISLPENTDTAQLEQFLLSKFKPGSVNIRLLQIGENQEGLMIEASDIGKDEIISAMEEKLGKISETDYSVETMGSSLGRSFFQEMFKALVVAFLFMGAVFFFYFADNRIIKWLVIFLAFLNFFVLLFSKNELFFTLTTILIVATSLYIYIKYNIPTLAALISAFLDIFISLAIITALGMKLTSGGIAAFLMLIGYSIDTSILLSTKVLKGENLDSGLFQAMKTGLTMSAAGLVATFVSWLLSNNTTLKQIMLILVIGLAMDLITTWIANVSLLRLYLERKNVKA
ncbi:hypothetical protein JW930_06255 [Candidatus Woesearchaeota archaeon]|nr:hypothetical protein [Candidatus Woesearchaeota archaeon]